MLDVIGKLGRHGIAVSASLMLSRLVGFVLLPFLTRYLSQAEYGVHDYLVLVATVLGLVAAQGVPSAVFREYAYSAKTGDDKRRVIATGLQYVGASTLVLMAACAALAAPVASVVIGDPGYAFLLVLVLVTHFCKNLTNVCAQILRADFRSGAFIAVYCGEFLLCVGLNVLFVIGMEMGLTGYVVSNLVGAAAALALALACVPQGLTARVDREALRRMVRFGLPLVPGALAVLALDSADRFFFRVLRPDDFQEVTGLFGRGNTFATILHGVLLMPFLTFWPGVYYDLAKRPTAAADLGRCASWYAAVGAFLALGLSCIARPLVALMTDAEFHEAWRVVPMLTFGLFLFGASEVTKAGVFIAGRTRVVPWLVLLAVGVSAALNLALIPRLGMTGAAWASLGAYGALAVASGIVAQRMFRVAYEWARLARVAFGIGVVLAAEAMLPHAAALAADLVLRGLLVVVLFPGVLWLSGFLDAAERAQLRRWLGRGRSV